MRESSQYIREVEYLLNRKIEAAPQKGVTFSAEQISMSGILYVKALRVIAERIHSRDIDEKRSALLRPSALDKLGKEKCDITGDIATQYAMIENARRITEARENSYFGGARKHQEPFLRDLIAFADMPPSQITLEDGTKHFIRGATVEAPTGSGKSYLLGKTLVGFGVGQSVQGVGAEANSRVRALVVTPSQTLVEELTGIVGDNSLEKFAPNMSFGAYYEREKNITADAVVTTPDQFITGFRDGKFNGQKFDLLAIDEAHHLTEPQFSSTLLENWQEGPAIGFTATPEYYPGKDVRDLLPHRIQHGDIVEYIEGDVLNAAQLFSVRTTFDPDAPKEGLPENVTLRNAELRHIALREATTSFMEPLVAQGRRGIIFCEISAAGAPPNDNALKMAEQLRSLTRPDGTPLRVAVAGHMNAGKSIYSPESNAGIRRRYAEREIDIIVTSDWGREGLNESIDFVLSVGTITSLLKFTQQIGRGTRLSTDFPVTVYGHIFTPTRNSRAQSIFSVFGFETIEQGTVIGVSGDSTTRVLKDGDTADLRAEQEAIVSLADFPEQMRALLQSIQSKTVAEALFDTEVYTHIPSDYLSFDELLNDVPGSRATILKHLRDVLGFKSISRFKTRFDGRLPAADRTREFNHYLEPATKDYIDQFRGAVARVDLQREFGGVDVTIVDGLAHACDVKHINWFNDSGQFIPHYTKHDADRVRQKFNETLPAESTDYSRKRLAELIGISPGSLVGRLLPHELAWVVGRRTTTANGKMRVLDHWQEKHALQIAARFKEMDASGRAPVYLVPRELAIKYIKVGKDTIRVFALETETPGIYVRGNRGGRPPLCFTWNIFRRAADTYGVKPDVPKIYFSELPTGPEDKDPERLAYARQVLDMLENL